jgi:hypothetical protein
LADDTVSPKLKRARAEIEAILRKHDIAGAVALHTPGHGEVFYNLAPSYSCIRGVPPLVRIRSKLQEDYAGNKLRQHQDREATANMVALLAESIGCIALSLIDLQEIVDAVFGSTHGDTTFVPDRDFD